MTIAQRQPVSTYDTRTIAEAWVAAVSRHLDSCGYPHILPKHVGYALVAFKQDMNAEACAREIMELERRYLRTVFDSL